MCLVKRNFISCRIALSVVALRDLFGQQTDDLNTELGLRVDCAQVVHYGFVEKVGYVAASGRFTA